MPPRLIPIDDPDDPRVAPFRDIRERDLVGRHDRFIAEGKVVLGHLLASPRFSAEAVLLLDSRVAGLTDILARAPEALPVHVAPAAVIDRIAGFHLHRGILAIGRRPPRQEPEVLLAATPSRALVVAAVGIANHDNMGGIFRNAAAFGADAVLLDPTCCDPLYRKAIRVSVGAVLKVPFATAASADGLAAALAAHGFSILALSPKGRIELAEARRPDRVALMLGAEGEGLPQALLDRLETVRIPMAPGFDSLNVAAASAIALHHLR